MGFDLNGTTLESSTGLIASQGSMTQIMKMNLAGSMRRYNPGQPMFRAGGSGTAANVGIGAVSTWVPIVLNSTNLNVGTCYNTANGRFTVPVAGVYLVTGSTYFTGAAGFYVHPMFYVNGSPTIRRPSFAGAHRMGGHGHTAGYIADSEAFEVIALLAGDYVQFYHYNSATAVSHTPQYARFEGYLLV